MIQNILFALSSTDYPLLVLRFKINDFFLLRLDPQAFSRQPLCYAPGRLLSLGMTLIFIYSLLFR